MVTGTTKLNLLARADVFCLPSVAEGFSNAVLEAMASVTPVMISPGCHFGEVEAENAGLVVERDLEKWMSALYSLLGNPAKLVNMGRNAFDLVEKKYAWLNVVSQLEETYREGIEGLNMTRTVSKVATWDSP
jgi:glycosyltransferase involved in cell wall biosynthesis